MQENILKFFVKSIVFQFLSWYHLFVVEITAKTIQMKEGNKID